MRAKNALRIAVGNYALVFKNLLYKSIVFVLFSVITGLVLNLTLNPLVEVARPLIKDFFDILISLFSGADYSAKTISLQTNFQAVKDFFVSHAGGLVATVIIIVVLVFLYKFLTGISDGTLMILVEGHMSGLSHRSFISVMIENLGRILIYQLIDTLCSFICVILVCVICWLVDLVLFSVLPLISVFVTVAVILCAISVYQTFFSQVMANILIGETKSIKKAFIDGIRPKKGYFSKMFAGYLTVTMILMYLHASVTVFTLGVGELLLIPFASLMLVTMKLVDYFTINKKKYFIDYDNIVVPKELRENDEELLNKVEI